MTLFLVREGKRSGFTLMIFFLVLAASYAFAGKEIDFPEGFGKINERFQGDPNRLVVIIQDAHRNYECQVNTTEIFNSIEVQQNIPLIALEGAAGEFITDWFSGFPDRQVSQDVSRYLLKEGRITSPEYFSMINDAAGSTELFGVEDRGLYIQNLESFKKAYAISQELTPSLLQVKEALARLKGKVYSPRLNELDELVEQYQKGALSFRDYFDGLLRISGDSHETLGALPHVALQEKIFDLEKKIPFQRLEDERAKLLNAVSAKLSPQKQSDLLVKSLQYKMNRMSALKYHDALWQLAGEAGIPEAEYPNVKVYHEYVRTIAQLSEPRLFEDISAWIARVKKTLIRSQEETTLEEVSRRVAFLERLLGLRITNSDFDDYLARKNDYRWEEIFEPVKALAEARQLDLYLPAEFKQVSEALPVFESFYQTALKRDEVMLQNTLGRMDERKYDLAVLVAGGFHTRGMARLLKEKGISYLVVTPKVTLRNVQTPYFSLLLNEKNPIERWIQPEAAQAGATQVPIQTGKDPIAYPEGQQILMRIFDLLTVGTQLLDSADERTGVIPEQARREILGNDRVVEMNERVQTDSFRIDFENAVSPRPQVIQIPVSKMDAQGRLVQSYVLLGRGTGGREAIEAARRAQGLRSDAGDVVPSQQGDIVMSVIVEPLDAVGEMREDRNRVLAAATDMGLDQARADSLMTQLAFGARDTSHLQDLLRDVLGDPSFTLTLNNTSRILSQLYVSARSAADHIVVSDLMHAALGNNLIEPRQRKYFEESAKNAQLLARSFSETGRLARYDFREGEAKETMGIGVDLDSIYELSVKENNSVTARLRAADAAIALKNFVAQGHKVVFFTLTSGVSKEKMKELLARLGIPETLLQDAVNLVDVNDVIANMKSPVAAAAFNPNRAQHVGRPGNEGQARDVTTTLVNLIKERTQVDDRNIVLVASDESILRNKLAQHLVVVIGHPDAQDTQKITSFSEGLIMINEVRRMLKIGRDYNPPDELVNVLVERLRGVPGWENPERVKQMLRGAIDETTGAVAVVQTPPRQPAATDYLQDVAGLEEELVGQAA